MRPSFFNRIDRMIFTSHTHRGLLERAADVGLAIVIGLALAGIFWG